MQDSDDMKVSLAHIWADLHIIIVPSLQMKQRPKQLTTNPLGHTGSSAGRKCEQ